ncbi:hypothetical protein HDE_05854 [Halotydeus destructor]|nr:hypothetical protein HDE_05854 [Halotydeus destructor]
MAATKQHQPQHCLRNEVISYDSDDEMVRSSGHRRSVYGTRTTKNGHPIYSREDIREQYCITRTELCVFEDGAYQESRLFGCLSTSHLPDHSPCNRNSSFLLSCVQKRKSSVDLDRKPSSTSLSNSSKQHERSVDDDEDSDGGFKRRPKPKTCLVSQQEHYRHTWASSSCSVPYSRPCSQEEVDIHHGRHCGQQGIQHHHQQPPQPLDNVCSHYSAQQGTNVFYGHHQPLSQIQSFNGYVQHCPPNGAPYCWPQSTATCSNQPRQDIRNGAHGLCGLETMYGRGSHSVDELNGHPNGHHVWHGHPQNQYGASSATMARTPDLLQTGGGGGGAKGTIMTADRSMLAFMTRTHWFEVTP